jgi:hypothetical protein
MKKIFKNPPSPQSPRSIDDYEYGVADLSDEIDDKIQLLAKTRGRAEKNFLLKEIRELITLYDETTGRKNYKDI